MDIKLEPKNAIEKEIQISGDRDIAAGALILASISDGISTLSNFPDVKEIDYAVCALRLLGVNMEINGSGATVFGAGLNGLKKPDFPIEIGDNTKLAFLLTGLLAPQNFDSEIVSEVDLTKSKFPEFCRLISEMNGSVTLSAANGKSVIRIKGGKLLGKEHHLSFYSPASKGALFLAGLYAENETSVIEAYPSHTHMENLISAFGGEVGICHHSRLVCHKAKALQSQKFFISGDVSEALFYLCAGALCSDSRIRVKNVCLNSSRIGFLYTFLDMGIRIKIPREKESLGEAYGDIEVLSSDLKAISIDQNSLPRIINELPFIITLCIFADGKSVIKKADFEAFEDIKPLLERLFLLGAEIEENENEIKITGQKYIEGGNIYCESSYKTVNLLALAALRAKNGILLKIADAVEYNAIINNLKNLR